MASYDATYRGRIVSGADPLNRGRAQLQVPEVLGTSKTGWAEPALPGLTSPFAGMAVLVTFINGDPASPIWWGSGQGTLVLAPAPGKTGITVIDGGGSDIVSIVLILDHRKVPIAWVNNVGGAGITDDLYTTESIYHIPANLLDIYGNRLQNGTFETTHDGPPGNMLAYVDACQRIFQGSRLPTVGNWLSAFGAPPTVVEVENPIGTWSAVEVISPGATMAAVTGTGSFAYPINPVNKYSSLIHIKAGSAVRQAQCGLQWFTSAGVTIGQTLGPLTNTSQDAWQLTLSGELTPPGDAYLACPIAYWPVSSSGESHLLCGAAMYKGNVTEWSPPFVAQPHGVYGEARPSDRWWRRSTPTVPNQRLYLCTVGGLPHQQEWVGVI